jgi:hypothetical protein
MDLIETMLFEIASNGTPTEVTIGLIAKGVPIEYAISLEQAAINIWGKYGEILLLYLCLPLPE